MKISGPPPSLRSPQCLYFLPPELQGSSASETEADRSTASETLGEVRSASDPREGGDDADVGGDDADVGGDDADVGGGDDAEVGGDDADVGGASDEKGEGGKSKEKSGKMRGEGDGKVYNIHLSLPGVQQPVTVMVSTWFSGAGAAK